MHYNKLFTVKISLLPIKISIVLDCVTPTIPECLSLLAFIPQLFRTTNNPLLHNACPHDKPFQKMVSPVYANYSEIVRPTINKYASQY